MTRERIAAIIDEWARNCRVQESNGSCIDSRLGMGSELVELLVGGEDVMHEPSDGEAIDEDEQLASLVGVPEGIGPRVNPDCPICTGGRGLPCSWHPLS